MYTTQDERGILNNFANEPKVYLAEYPSSQQQRQYLILGGLVVGLISTLITIALNVS
jgi:hypothetical protein